jgi:NAD(P)-dependent dehydrogenase (short-subunit alcohol dehydrogenase family)
MNKTALVTGSSRGIGKSVAIELAKAGFTVVVHGSRKTDQLDTAFAEVQLISPKSICLTADLTDPSAIDNMFAEIKAKFGSLDVLINNAAVQNPSPILDLKLEDWDRIMFTNLRAVFLCGQHAGRMMRDAGGGKIINVSSVHDTAPRRYFAHYSSAKGGLVMLTKTMALELADFNIQCNFLTIGAIATEMTDPDRQNLLLPSIPANRIGTPAEVGKLICYLVSPDASYITGAGIIIDGGLTLGFCATRPDL